MERGEENILFDTGDTTHLAMMAIKGDTNRFMYLEAGSYALLNLQARRKKNQFNSVDNRHY